MKSETVTLSIDKLEDYFACQLAKMKLLRDNAPNKTTSYLMERLSIDMLIEFHDLFNFDQQPLSLDRIVAKAKEHRERLVKKARQSKPTPADETLEKMIEIMKEAVSNIQKAKAGKEENNGD